MTTRELLARGFRALSQGNINEAATCCKLILARHPEAVQAHFLVGLVGLASNDRNTATTAFSSVVGIEPQHAAAWAHLAKLLAEGGQVNRADVALENAVKFENDDIPQVHDVIGTAYSLLGEYQNADLWYGRAAREQADNPTFRINHANNLIYLGKTGPARKELVAALAIGPGSAQAHWLISGLDKALNRDHIEDMQSLLTKRQLPSRARAFLYYGIGKELEDLEEWEDAFAALDAGAQARRSTLEYDEAQEEATFDSLTRVYTPQWLASRPAGCDNDSPIFIVGQPRTGTTLVERIISAHSQVHSAGELQQFGNCIRRLTDYDRRERFSPELFDNAATIDPLQLGTEYLQRSAKLRGSLPRFVDKLPYNYMFLPHLLAALPKAKIIHLVRDPRDVCFSVYKQFFADAYPHSYKLDEMARHFVRYYRLMDVWRERFPGSFLDVRYEDVVADLEGNARRILNYLELPWEDACAQFHKQNSAVSTASAVQVRQPAHTRSVGRWQRYAEQLRPALDILQREGLIS
ncbi:MAG: sulfotransferase family protein [Gammaproteobacteria bacterium]|nr:MAG: sulfotransferase family protein [Gammaproteobacteria bacterium]RLA61054.1 MAG: sulfotransferase family protein [Gammaproteobacteria bacterium]